MLQIVLSSPYRAKTVASWVLQIVLAAAFLVAGAAKLAGVPMMVQVFDQLGVGQWFRIVTGLVEVAGGVALLVPGFAALGAAVLGTTMIGAVFAHIFILPEPMVPALVLLVLAAVVVWLRRDQFTALIEALG
jgi:uncharacterized membrane protein YphA (DoxX/SURF4 family)